MNGFVQDMEERGNSSPHLHFKCQSRKTNPKNFVETTSKGSESFFKDLNDNVSQVGIFIWGRFVE